MAGTTDVGMDVVDELRLRRWARQHHVAAEERDASWHPIVLDEICLRDRKHEMTHRPHVYAGALVPLVPYVPAANVTATAGEADGTLLFRIDTAARRHDAAD